MPSSLCYGPGTLLEIDVDPRSLMADFSRLTARPIDDPVDAVCAALAAPEGFPALRRATVPGDQVVVAVEHDVPQQAAVVAGIVHSLVEGNVLPEDVTILLSGGPSRRENGRIDQLLSPQFAAEVKIVQHDPHEAKSLAYLAASKENKPIYFNRLLFDADLVLPVGCLRPGSSLGYLGVHGSLFPAFSDNATQQRFRSAGTAQSSVQQKRHASEAGEAAWLLGVHLMLQVVPGLGDTLLHVLAGEAETVAKHGRSLCEAAWLHRLAQNPQLVVAAIEGDSEVQTWENFGRALHAALAVTADHGAIVLCTDLRCRPGPALQRLASESDDQVARHEILRDRSHDALAALLLLDGRSRVEIYLLSGLAEDTVEELGIGYVTGPEQIARLSRQYGSCILLGDAHRAMLELNLSGD
jgi:nickel-dependent lactate racemase